MSKVRKRPKYIKGTYRKPEVGGSLRLVVTEYDFLLRNKKATADFIFSNEPTTHPFESHKGKVIRLSEKKWDKPIALSMCSTEYLTDCGLIVYGRKEIIDYAVNHSVNWNDVCDVIHVLSLSLKQEGENKPELLDSIVLTNMPKKTGGSETIYIPMRAVYPDLLAKKQMHESGYFTYNI